MTDTVECHETSLWSEKQVNNKNKVFFVNKIALLWVILIVVFLLAITVTVIYATRQNSIKIKITAYLENELRAISPELRRILYAGNYEKAGDLLTHLFQTHEDWLTLKSIAPNGTVIIDISRENPSNGPRIEIKQEIALNENNLLLIYVNYDAGEEYGELKIILGQVTVGFILIVGFLLSVVWLVIRKYFIIPLENLRKDLQQREERIRLLLDSTSDGIYSNDLNGICTMANSTCAKLLGYENLESLLGKPSHQLFHHSRPDGTPYPEKACIILQAVNNKKPITVDNEVFWRADGKNFPVEYRAAPIFHEENIVGIVVSFTDVSRRRATEMQLRQAQKLEAIGQLAAGIAHEINTPTQFVSHNTLFLKDSFGQLQELLAYYDELLESMAKGEFNHEFLAEIKSRQTDIDIDFLREEIPESIDQSLEGLKRITKIVMAMKEFSHPGSEEKKFTDINRAIEITLDVSRNEWKYCAEMVTLFDKSLPPVPCLPGEFNQVILNMVVNAAHAVSSVRKKQPDELGRITIQTSHDETYAEIRISDTGCGIPVENQHRIFDPFFTTKEVGKGTGQGLAISYSTIVDKHNGTISFESEERVGTTFIIRLPLKNNTGSMNKNTAPETLS